MDLLEGLAQIAYFVLYLSFKRSVLSRLMVLKGFTLNTNDGVWTEITWFDMTF